MTTDAHEHPGDRTRQSLWTIVETIIHMISPTNHLDATSGRAPWAQAERWVAATFGSESAHMEALRIVIDPSPWGDLHRELVSDLLAALLERLEQA